MYKSLSAYHMVVIINILGDAGISPLKDKKDMLSQFLSKFKNLYNLCIQGGGKFEGSKAFIDIYNNIDKTEKDITQLSYQNDFIISPNPGNGIFTINIKEYELIIYNVFGEKVYSLTQQINNSVIDISSQPSGVYFLQVITGEGVMVKKIVKE